MFDERKNEIKEEFLTAAGFKIFAAHNPQEESRLKLIPQRELVSVHGATIPTYMYADDEGCHCLYVGDEAALAEYHRLSGVKRSTDNRLIAADMLDTWSMGGFSGQGGVGAGAGLVW